MSDQMPRFVRHLLLGIVCVVPAALAFAPPVGAAEPIIQVEPTLTAITLAPEATTSARIPYSQLATSDAGLTLTVQAVVRDKVPVNVTNDVVSVAPDTELDVLEVTIDGDELDRVGTYTVSLRVTADKPATAQSLALTITRPDADLILPTAEPIEIERTVWFPELGWELPKRLKSQNGDQTDPPVVAQVGDDGRLISLSARPLTTDDAYVAVTKPDNEGESDTNQFELISEPVGPGTLFELFESVEGDPPLGTIQRSVRLSSPQLVKPVDVSYSITTRRSTALIPLTVLIGLLFGLLARTLPTWFNNRSVTEERLRTLTLQLEGLKRHPDRQVRKVAKSQLALLSQSRKRGTAKRNKTMDQAIAAMKPALAQADAAVAKQLARLEADERIVRRGWSVPAITEALLEQIRQRLDAGFTLTDAGNARDTELLADQVDDDLTSLLDRAIKSDAHALHQAADGIALAFDSTGRPRFDELATWAKTLGDDAAQPPEAPQPAANRLEWLHTISGRADDLAARFAQAFQELTATDDNDLHRAEQKTRIQEQLKSGKAGAGLVTARADIESYATGMKVRPTADEVKALGDDTAEVAATPETDVPDAAMQVWTARAPRRYWREAESSARIWGLARFALGAARFVVLLVLLIVVSYNWLATDWTGSLSDISTVLIWAFGVDLTAEFVVQSAKVNPIKSSNSGGAALLPGVAADGGGGGDDSGGVSGDGGGGGKNDDGTSGQDAGDQPANGAEQPVVNAAVA